MKIQEFSKVPSSDVAIVIPVLNEGQRIVDQVDRMRSLEYDLIVLDGGSSDESINKIASNPPPNLKYILTTFKYEGLSTDLYLGLKFAKDYYKFIVTIDGNGKDEVALITHLVDYARRNKIDFIQGSRWLEPGGSRNLPWDRFILIKFFISPLMSIVSRRRITDPTNQLRVFSNFALALVTNTSREFKRYDYFFWIPIVICRSNYNFAEVFVKRNYPKNGPIPTKISRTRFPRLGLDLIKVCLRWKKYLR